MWKFQIDFLKEKKTPGKYLIVVGVCLVWDFPSAVERFPAHH